jgi:hypothetical protein
VPFYVKDGVSFFDYVYSVHSFRDELAGGKKANENRRQNMCLYLGRGHSGEENRMAPISPIEFSL